MRADWMHANSALQTLSASNFYRVNSSRVPLRVAEYADGWMLRKQMYKGDALADLKAACIE